MNFARQYYQSAELVARFDRYPDIRRTQFVFEDEMRSEFPSPSQVLNQGPNVAPDAPRFVLASGKRALLVSEIAAQLNLDFSDAPVKTDVFSVIRKYAVLLDKAVGVAVPAANRDFSGLVLKLAYAYSGDVEDVAGFIYDRLVKVDAPANVVSASIDLGFQPSDSAYLNFNFYTYKRINFTPSPSPTPLFANLEEMDASEVGFEVKVDANNKPIRRSQTLDLSLVSLCDVLIDGCGDTLNRFLGSDFASQRKI